MSVSIAHNVIGGFNLSPKQKRELARLLISDATPKNLSDFEWAKNDFKARLRESSKQHINK